MSEHKNKTLEEIIFSSAIYKDAQENFLLKGLQGATETMLKLLGGHSTYCLGQTIKSLVQMHSNESCNLVLNDLC